MKKEFIKDKFVKILRSTEKYTRTDMVYLFRSGLWSLFSQVVGSACSFVVVVFLANTLSKELFGQYRFILSVLSILILFTLPGIGTSLILSIARNYNVDLPKIVRAKILWGLVGTCVALFLSVYYFYNGNSELVSAIILSAIFLPFIEPFNIYSSYFKGKQDFRTSEIYESICRIFQATFIIIFAFFFKSVFGVVLAYLVGQIIIRFFFYKKTLKAKEDNEVILNSEDHTYETIKYGKYLSAIQAISTITANIDKLLVWHFLGAEMLAIYYIALTIPKNIVLVCNIIPRVAFPKFSQNTWESHERAKILRKLMIFVGILIIPVGFYMLLIPFAIPLIFKNYNASIPAALILGFLIILSPANALIDRMLQSMKAVKKIIFLQVFTLSAFSCSFLLLYRLSAVSAVLAATALVISELASLMVGIYFIRKTN